MLYFTCNPKKEATFLIQYSEPMVILIPVVLMFITAGVLVIVRFMRRNYKYFWMIAIGGATLALVGVFAWQLLLPQSISLATWQPSALSSFSPTWVADSISWPYALVLAALAAAIVWTSIVRGENDPLPWSGTLVLGALGILAVTADNPLTLILAWSALDLTELFTMLRSREGEEQSRSVVIAFAARVAGTGLVIWGSLASLAAGNPINFSIIPNGAGIYLLLAAGLRLGVFPLHLPYQKENTFRRGFGTSLRLTSAAASLSLLARIPASAINISFLPYLIILAALASLYAGWMWLRASDEIVGRPFWVLGMASLAIAGSLLGNPIGSMGWGIMLVLGGGILFLFSARQRSIIWVPLLSLWGMSTLPFSTTASAWQVGNHISTLFIIPFLPAQALLATGIIRHSLHPGETSFESQERWTKFLYPTGLLLLGATIFLLGIWGWRGAQNIGQIWAAIAANILVVGFTVLALKILVRLPTSSTSNQWTRIFRLEWLFPAMTTIYEFFRKIADIITSSLEGEGGLLWSLLLLALIFSILSTQAR
jgi:hypothetical protein